MSPHKELALQALGQMRGDDHMRARHAFSRFTPEQMQEQHGESGLTRAQVLQGYEDHVARVDAAIEWVKSLAEPSVNPVDIFHAHLDACQQCRERPFDLCPEGARLLSGTMQALQASDPAPGADA